ncbi:C-C chemokine receptor type 8-like [Gymnodraco acuticeps]|uniref:C-C chemokine receptor type 8-like n=1 Tax=Gymnodraco acuticeps TaxID=8218 RepID=A0A6P8VTU0_GYMAC|nr:C-C chemokine receptor type 8-like [Gymnodraco acuticeps]
MCTNLVTNYKKRLTSVLSKKGLSIKFEKLTTVTNILLLNMVVSSLIFMSSLPFEALDNQLSEWIFGDVMCRIVGSVYYLGFYSSVLLLTLLTFDRHLAVVYSLNAARVRNQRYAVISCAAIWVISSLACIRPMILYKTFKYMNTTLCQQFPLDVDSLNMEMLRTSGFYIQLLLFWIFPLSVIIYCYVRIAISVISWWCCSYREEAGFALSSRAERFSPPASQIREDGAPHPAALGWAARPRECWHAGSTGWAEEVEGAAGTGSPCRHLSLRLTVALRSLVCRKPVEERAAVLEDCSLY